MSSTPPPKPPKGKLGQRQNYSWALSLLPSTPSPLLPFHPPARAKSSHVNHYSTYLGQRGVGLNLVGPEAYANWGSHINKRVENKVLVTQSCPTLCDPMNCSLPSRILCPWDFPGKNTGMGSHSLLQEIFSIQGSNPRLSHWRQILYHLSHQVYATWRAVGGGESHIKK